MLYLFHTFTCCLYDSVRILTVRTVNQTYCTVCTVDQTSKLKFSQNIEVEVLQFGKIEEIFFEDLSVLMIASPYNSNHIIEEV